MAPLVVALAATIVRERGLGVLAKDLEVAFFRLLEDPVEADPGCRGKLAIADALRELDVHAVDVFLSGVGFRQPEPSFGRPSDTAGPLRVCCAQGLLQVLHPRALFEIAQLRRWLMGVRAPRSKKAYLRIELEPGEQAQVDWGSFGQMRCGTTMHCRALDFFGGVPKKVLSTTTSKAKPPSCAASSHSFRRETPRPPACSPTCRC
jgi:hypothetical protein